MNFHLLAVALAGLASFFLSATESAPCPNGTVSMNVTSAADVKNLTEVINCTGQGDFDITWNSSVTLSEVIEFSDLKNVAMTGVGFPTIRGRLYDENDSGALVYAGGGTGIFSVSGGSTLSLTSLVLEGGSTKYGAAVELHSSSYLFVYDCTFSNNNASSGGAIYAFNASVDVHGSSTFTNNYALHGGAVYAWNSKISIGGNTLFIRNTANGSIDTTSFSGVNFSDSSGGAIYAEDSTMNMDGDCSFADNSADFGGAIYAEDSSMHMDGDCSFADNSAGWGGAIYVSRSNMAFEGITIFSYNSADFDGGAVHTYNSTTIMNGSMNQSGDLAGKEGYLEVEGGPELLSNIWFIGNAAVGLGGAMHIQDTHQLECTGVAFEKNSAQLGGAIYVVSTRDTLTQFNDCVFEKNEAPDGGAIYLATGSGVDKFTSSVFRDNFANFSGGAIFSMGSLHVVNTIFEANGAGVEGPAIISIGQIKELFNVSFSDNSFYCRETKYGYVDINEIDPCQSCFDDVCARCSTGHLRGGDFENIRTNGKPVCEDPPAGAFAISSGTTVTTLSLDKGYFRTSNKSHKILKCFNQNACVGGADTAKYCAPGYTGPYCAVCDDGYTAGLAYSCNICSERRKRSAWGLTIAVCLASVLLMGLMFVHLGGVARDGAVEDTGEARRSWGKTWWSCQRSLVKILPLRAIKITVTVWQIISQFDAVAGDVYPELYKAFVSTLTAVNLDLNFVLSFSCLVATDFYHRLLVTTITPLVMLVMLAGSYVVAKRKNDCSESAKRAVRRKHQSALLYFAFFIYSPVSYVIFQTFSCDELDDGNSYLRADYSLSCKTAQHVWFKVYALIMVGIYPFGIAAVFACVLTWNRHDLVKPDRESVARLKPFHGLWAAYKPSRYFYEVVECVRRVSLTAIAAFVPSNSVAQISIALLFAVVWVFISEALSPFEKNGNMNIYRWGNGIIVGSMYVAFLANFDVGDDKGRALLTFSGVLILANVFMVVTVILQTALLAKEWRQARVAVRALDVPVRRAV